MKQQIIFAALVVVAMLGTSTLIEVCGCNGSGGQSDHESFKAPKPREQCGANCDVYAYKGQTDKFVQANCCRLIPCKRRFGDCEFIQFKNLICGTHYEC